MMRSIFLFCMYLTLGYGVFNIPSLCENLRLTGARLIEIWELIDCD